MRTLIGIVVLLLSTTMAMADCEPVFDGKNGPVYMCPLAPAEPRVKCWMVDETRLCNGQIGQKIERDNVVKPDNCGRDRRGRYRCW